MIHFEINLLPKIFCILLLFSALFLALMQNFSISNCNAAIQKIIQIEQLLDNLLEKLQFLRVYCNFL